MFGSPLMRVLWIAFAVFLILWIVGLALTWGGWVWVFFALLIIALALNIMAILGRGARRPRF